MEGGGICKYEYSKMFLVICVLFLLCMLCDVREMVRMGLNVRFLLFSHGCCVFCFFLFVLYCFFLLMMICNNLSDTVIFIITNVYCKAYVWLQYTQCYITITYYFYILPIVNLQLFLKCYQYVLNV